VLTGFAEARVEEIVLGLLTLPETETLTLLDDLAATADAHR
jgi:hypothetical protein